MHSESVPGLHGRSSGLSIPLRIGWKRGSENRPSFRAFLGPSILFATGSLTLTNVFARRTLPLVTAFAGSMIGFPLRRICLRFCGCKKLAPEDAAQPRWATLHKQRGARQYGDWSAKFLAQMRRVPVY
jgi:hypothetical protein